MQSSLYKKIVALICLSSISGSALMLPSYAVAQEPVSTTVSLALGSIAVPINKVQELPGTLKDLANGIAWKVAKLLVHNLTNQIVNLIRTGGQGGAPLFVTNWQDFLLDAADQASGVFLEELKLTALCQPFGARIRLLLAGGRRPFHERARCTVSNVLQNVQAFYQDFSQGGWQRWFEITQIPQNNFYGAYYLAMEENLVRQSAAVEASLNQAKAGGGFLNIEECKDKPIVIEDETGGGAITVPDCQTVSPGKWLEQRVAKATNSDIDQLNLADSFNEILFAAFETLMRTLFFQQGGLRSSNISSISIQPDLATLQADGIRSSGVDSAIAVTELVIATKENSLAKVKDTIVTLSSLKKCKQDKNEPLNEVNNRIQTAASTQKTLEGNIIDLTILKETLKDDKLAIQLSKTVNEFQAALQKTQEDVAKTPDLSSAQTENNSVSETKSQAENDLKECLKPPED